MSLQQPDTHKQPYEVNTCYIDVTKFSFIFLGSWLGLRIKLTLVKQEKTQYKFYIFIFGVTES